jgi:hypothetical protein
MLRFLTKAIAILQPLLHGGWNTRMGLTNAVSCSIQTQQRLIHIYHAVHMPLPCLSLAMTCRLWFILRPSHLIYTLRPCLIHICHAAPMLRPYHASTMPFWKRFLKATAQRGMGMAWHVWISIGCPETCGRSARVRLLSGTTRSSTKVVTRSIPIR